MVKFYFGGTSTVVFCVTSSGSVFQLSVSGNARFLLAVQFICTFGKFFRIS